MRSSGLARGLATRPACLACRCCQARGARQKPQLRRAVGQQSQRPAPDRPTPAALPASTPTLTHQVVLKIIKHCRENFPETIAGSLLGFEVEGRMEITNSFPYPLHADEAAEDGEEVFEVVLIQRTPHQLRGEDEEAAGEREAAAVGVAALDRARVRH